MKDWEIIADRLGKAGWSWGCSSDVDSADRVLFTADTYRSDGKRFIVTADEKLTAFLELERVTRDGSECPANARRRVARCRGVAVRRDLRLSEPWLSLCPVRPQHVLHTAWVPTLS